MLERLKAKLIVLDSNHHAGCARVSALNQTIQETRFEHERIRGIITTNGSQKKQLEQRITMVENELQNERNKLLTMQQACADHHMRRKAILKDVCDDANEFDLACDKYCNDPQLSESISICAALESEATHLTATLAELNVPPEQLQQQLETLSATIEQYQRDQMDLEKARQDAQLMLMECQRLLDDVQGEGQYPTTLPNHHPFADSDANADDSDYDDDSSDNSINCQKKWPVYVQAQRRQLVEQQSMQLRRYVGGKLSVIERLPVSDKFSNGWTSQVQKW